MRKISALLVIGLLLLCLAPCAPVWAEDSGISYFWGFPGDTWTISNPTDSDIKLEDRQFGGYTYVITDADGLVTERVPNAQWKDPVIPAGGKAVVMNWQKQYAMQLDSQLEVTKDETPALIQADLQYFDCVEFTNKTDHSANVVYSGSSALSYVVFDKNGTITELVTDKNSFGGSKDITVSVPEGGRINVICCTTGWLMAQSNEYPKGSCMARSENFTLNEDARPAIIFFRLFEDMTRSFKNTSGAACDVFGEGDYVLYDAAGKVDSVGAMNYKSDYKLSVPAGWSVAFSAEGGYRTDGSSSTGSDGCYGVPSYAFTETNLAGLEYYTFPQGHTVTFRNDSGMDATISFRNGYSAEATIYNSADAVVKTMGGGVDIDVPAGHYAKIKCKGGATSYKVASGQFTVTHTPADAVAGKHHIELDRGESCILTNSTSEYKDISFSGQLDYRVRGNDGSIVSYELGDTKDSIRIPAGATLHATSAKGISLINADEALSLTENADPVAIHQTVTNGDAYLYDSVTGVGVSQYVGVYTFAYYIKDDVYHAFVSSPDAMQIVAWTESNVRKVDGGYFGNITLNKGEACELIVNKAYGTTPQIQSSKPCIMVGYPSDPEEEAWIELRANNIGYPSEDVYSMVVTAVCDGTKVQYPAQFYDAVKLKEDPLLYATVKKGEIRDFRRDCTDGKLQRLCLFGVNVNTREYSEVSGFAGYDWDRSDFWYFSGTGSPCGMVQSTDSDVLVVGVKGLVQCDPVVLRAWLYDETGNKVSYYDNSGSGAIILNCEATVSTPETMNVMLASYDSNDRFINCVFRQVKRSDLGPALKIPYSCGTNVEMVKLMVLDDQFRPMNQMLIPEGW